MFFNTIIGVITAALYLITGGLLGVRLSRDESVEIWDRRWLILLIGFTAVVLHTMLLAQSVLQPEGMNLGFFNALSCTGWLIALVLLGGALFHPVENLGIILLPYSALTVVLAMLFSSNRLVVSAEQWPLEAHIVISVLAYALLALAAMQAVLLAVQNYRLRHRHPGGFVRRLPPLIMMEALLFQLIGAGFTLLSLALLSGFMFLEDIFAQHLVHKTTLSLVAWWVFGTLLWGRWRFGWRGPTAIRWTLGGFFTLMLAYFGSKLVLELILQR